MASAVEKVEKGNKKKKTTSKKNQSVSVIEEISFV